MNRTILDRKNLSPNTATEAIATVAELPPRGTGFGDMRLPKDSSRL